MLARIANPEMLLLLPVVLALGCWVILRRRRRPRMRASTALFEGESRTTWRMRLLSLPLWLMLAAIVVLVLAASRPQTSWSESRRWVEGIDIMMVADVSGSMRNNRFFIPSRLDSAKQTMTDFVAGRENDRIGIVIFGADTFALCPLTGDYDALKVFIDRIDYDLIDPQATAIGDGLANGVKRLVESDAKSKVVILLTDGDNNAGRLDPLTASQTAKAFGIKVYTIAIGPVGANNGVLPRIASETGGRYFHATDDRSLEGIYAEIDQLERTERKIDETLFYDELGQYLMVPALLLLLLGFALENTMLRTFP